MSPTSEQVYFSEFDLFCVANDIEAGDTLLLQHTARGMENSVSRLGIYVGTNTSGTPTVLLDDGKKIFINPELLKTTTRAETFRVISKSIKPLKLKDIRK